MSFRDSQIDSYGFTNESTEDGGVESAFESVAKNGVVSVQNTVRSIGDQISRLAQSQPTQKTVSVMKSLLSESSSAISTVEGQFRQWRSAVCDDASSMRRKLILPKLEASFFAEVHKFTQTQEAVESIEKQLQASNSDPFSLMRPSERDAGHYPTSSQMVQFSPPSSSRDIDELTDLPLDQFLAKEQQLIAPVGWQPPATDQLSYGSSPYSLSGQRSPIGLPAVASLNRMNQQEALVGQRPSSIATGFAPLPPATIGRNFYDHADDDEDIDSEAPDVLIGVKKVMSSSSSTATGGSGSPLSEEGEGGRRSRPSTVSSNSTSPEHRVNRLSVPNASHTTTTDDFLEDDYLYQSHHRPNTLSQGDDDENDDEEDEELSGLLSRGSVRSASYLDGWHLTVDKPRQDDDLELYVSRERLRGVHRIKAQLSQISHVFRELAHLIHEQQEDLDLIDSSMGNVKSVTGSAVDELRRANVLKQRARRRNFFMILLTILVGAIVVFVYLLQSPSSSSQPSLATNPLAHPSSSHQLLHPPLELELDKPLDEVVVDQAQGRVVKDLDYSGLSSDKRLPKK